jgi:DNA-binding transcriptional LysR family regulator
MAELDLNLLRVLVALEETRSVSATALRLQRSQPAVSAALSRLRESFDDRLFVRAGNVMQPTPRAAGLVASARTVLARIESEIVAAPRFDPARSHRTIAIALSDVGEVELLPTIMREVRKRMPNAGVRSVSLPAADVARGLESGAIDLAIGYFPDLKKRNFFQQALFTGTFCSLVSVRHPIAAKKLTLKQFMALDHVVVRAESRSEEVMERYLAKKRIRRRVVLTTPHFASAPMIVAQSNFIVTVPESLADYLAKVSSDVRIVGLPFEPPRIALKQFWHRKFHEDARNRWLRNLMCELFQEPTSRSER